MKRYHEFTFRSPDTFKLEEVAAQFADAAITGMQEEPGMLRVYVEEATLDRELPDRISQRSGISYTETTVEDQNWNALWESNFEPIQVDDFVYVRADFHPPVTGAELEIVITPKMSFGTGHHATTYLMMQQMRTIDFRNAMVFDFGTGTGILSILAEKLGARETLAVDHDEWSIMNARENLDRNGCRYIKLVQADNAGTGSAFGVILANINKNVILANAAVLAASLNAPGILLLSGLLPDDGLEITNTFKELGLAVKQQVVKDNWLCLKLSAPDIPSEAH